MKLGLRIVIASAAIATGVGLPLVPATAATTGSGTVEGLVFADGNRNGVQDPGEQPFSGQDYDLASASGVTVATVRTDANGRFSVPNVSDGTYTMRMHPSSWLAVRDTWVPTTTGSVWPTTTLVASGGGTARLGWRPIQRSTDPGAPLSQYVGPSGLDVRSYTDAVDARAVHDAVVAGSLVGAEASFVRVFFGYSDTSSTAMSVSGSAGTYSDYTANVNVSYRSWLDDADTTLHHEYGHAWSMYYAYLAQQDAQLTSYLKARGIYGDTRLDTNHAWDRRELIAEDFRQLFGSARAAATAQEQSELPPASTVPGLREFLTGQFRSAAASSPAPSPTPSSSPTPAAALSVENVSMNPTTVRTTGTASARFTASANCRVEVRDSRGQLVKVLADGQAVSAATYTWSWDRSNSAGARVKAGAYSLSVLATTPSSQARGAASFTVK